MTQPESVDLPYDAEDVIADLQAQVGSARGEAARLRGVIAKLLRKQNETARENDRKLSEALAGTAVDRTAGKP